MRIKQEICNTGILVKSIGENIEHLRLQKRKSIKEMAALLNLTHTGYRNIERGKTEMSITKVFQIANILNVPFFQILDYDNSLEVQNSNRPNREVNTQLLQHYKEEISFLRKQLELTYVVSKTG